MKKIMKRAHEIAKTLEGDYRAKMSLALKLAWKESKTTKKVVIVKETSKAKMLVLRFNDILGNERKINAWFPKTWLENNNVPKIWAINKKANEISELHREWCLKLIGIDVA